MTTKSSIHIKPCNVASNGAHNRRTAEYMRNIGASKIYIVSELSADNEQRINSGFGNPIGEWFKEEWKKLKQGLRQSAEEPRKSRGFKL